MKYLFLMLLLTGCYTTNYKPLPNPNPIAVLSGAPEEKNLQSIFDDINKKAFNEEVNASISWFESDRLQGVVTNYPSCTYRRIFINKDLLDKGTEQEKWRDVAGVVAHEMIHSHLKGKFKKPHGPEFRAWVKHIAEKTGLKWHEIWNHTKDIPGE